MKILALLLLAVAANAAIPTLVQSGPNTCKVSPAAAPGTDTLTCTLSGVTSGNTIMVGVGIRADGENSVQTISDSFGSRFFSLGRATGPVITSTLWSTVANGSGSDTVTVTLYSPYYSAQVVLAEYANLSVRVSRDPGLGAGSLSANACGQLTPAVANAVLIGLDASAQGSGAFIAPTGFTSRVTGVASTLEVMLTDKFLTVPATVSPVFTTATAQPYACIVAAMAPAVPLTPSPRDWGSTTHGEITVKHAPGIVPDHHDYAADKLQDAIDATTTACGDIIEIAPGAARYNLTPYQLRGPDSARDCSSSGKYITIRSSKAYQLTPGKRVGAADEQNLAFIGLLPSAPCTVFQTERAANYYRLQGLDLASPERDCIYGGNAIVEFSYSLSNGESALTRVDNFPHHLIIDQCWLHGIEGYSARDGVHPQGISIQLLNSSIENLRTSVQDAQESHGIVEGGGIGPIRVVNTKINSSGIHVLWGGGLAPMKNRMDGIEFTNNWLYRPFKWLDWAGTTAPSPSSPCPVDSDGHGATYRNTSAGTYWECQGALPGTWTQLASGDAYNALVIPRISTWNKNLFEIKGGSRLHMEGNLLDQSYSWGFQQQGGNCFLFNAVYGSDVQESHLLIENNICQNATAGMTAGTDQESYNVGPFWTNDHPFSDAVIRNNLFQHMGQDTYTYPTFGDISQWGQTSVFNQGLGSRYAEGITFDHMTWQSELSLTSSGYQNSATRNDAFFNAANPNRNQRMTNSVFTTGLCPFADSNGHGCDNIAIANSWGPHSELAANALLDNLGIVANPSIAPSGYTAFTQHCDPGSVVGCPYGNAKTLSPPNCLGCQYMVPSAALFTSYPTDLTLQSTSPLKAAGLDGKDLGADLNTVGWATAGAQAGTMAPYLAMKIRSVIPAATSLQVRFSAPDTTSCTVAARVYGFPLSSPTSTVTDNSGTLDRLVTLTGLTSNTKYGLKVTCAGSYYREDEFRTP